MLSFPHRSAKVSNRRKKGGSGVEWSQEGGLLQLLEELGSSTLRGAMLEVEVWWFRQKSANSVASRMRCGIRQSRTYILRRNPPWVPCDLRPRMRP